MTPEEKEIQLTKIRLMKVGIGIAILGIILFAFYAFNWVEYIKICH